MTDQNPTNTSGSYYIGQPVIILDGPFANAKGTIDLIDQKRLRLRVIVRFYGRDTPVEFQFNQVHPISST